MFLVLLSPGNVPDRAWINMGRSSYTEEVTKALDEEKSGSSTQEDPKARKCTNVSYLAS